MGCSFSSYKYWVLLLIVVCPFCLIKIGKKYLLHSLYLEIDVTSQINFIYLLIIPKIYPSSFYQLQFKSSYRFTSVRQLCHILVGTVICFASLNTYY